ncbi:MAG: hypothetical protein KDA05_08065 [Phycisphaerales bacterium]|nr:hypothetical protein [Phycisphaerales bacterium]MCB9841304.1 hypothetical protein [Phycisphaeraceae bacterium]
MPRRARSIVAALALAAALGVGGCSSFGQGRSTSDWRYQSPGDGRVGVGDSLGNALFLRHVQLAKAAQFEGSPVFASVPTDE